MLFEGIVFGPIRSRRLGCSLGVNLLPEGSKICSFDCLYCECGFNRSASQRYPSFEEVSAALEERLSAMRSAGEGLDVITFAGNGEPTLHPQFEAIVDRTIALRDAYYPAVKISVLSNATRLRNDAVVNALKRVDNNILKLDSAIDATMRCINQPTSDSITVSDIVEGMKRFEGNLIVQTLLVEGEYKGVHFDNTTPAEVEAWLEAMRKVRPRSIMLYSLDRRTPVESLRRPSVEVMQRIAALARAEGFDVMLTV